MQMLHIINCVDMHNCTDIIIFNVLGEWISLTVTGDRPPPIAKFTLTSITDTTAILFGGCTSNENNSNDVYKFIFDETSVVSAILLFYAYARLN